MFNANSVYYEQIIMSFIKALTLPNTKVQWSGKKLFSNEKAASRIKKALTLPNTKVQWSGKILFSSERAASRGKNTIEVGFP